MHDQVRMGVRHGIQHLFHQPETTIGRQPSLVGIAIDAHAVHVFEDEIWHAAHGHDRGRGDAAAADVGWLAGRGQDRTPARTVLTMVVGNLVVYVFGLPWLMAAVGVGLATGKFSSV